MPAAPTPARLSPAHPTFMSVRSIPSWIGAGLLTVGLIVGSPMDVSAQEAGAPLEAPPEASEPVAADTAVDVLTIGDGTAPASDAAPRADAGKGSKTDPVAEEASPEEAEEAVAPEAGLASASATTGSGIDPGASLGSHEPREEVDPFAGSFATAVPIAVPAFHGIAPDLALTYGSSRGNGFVGVGWGLSGLPVIERASPGRGSPLYHGTTSSCSTARS